MPTGVPIPISSALEPIAPNGEIPSTGATTFSPIAETGELFDYVAARERARRGRRRAAAALAVLALGSAAAFFALRPTAQSPSSENHKLASAASLHTPEPSVAPTPERIEPATPEPVATASSEPAPSASAAFIVEEPAANASAPSAPPSTPAAPETPPAARRRDETPAGAAKTAENAGATHRRAKTGDGSFDEDGANEALAQAVQSAASCKGSSSPEGVARVSVTFAPSGQVTSATVGPPFAGTLEAECISAKFRALHVAPFSGDYVILRKSVRLQ